MADAPGDTKAKSPSRQARLAVAPARQEESGQGVARMPRSAFQSLGITEGDVVEITGKRTTAAIAMAAYPEDDTLDVVATGNLIMAGANPAAGWKFDTLTGKFIADDSVNTDPAGDTYDTH